MMTEDHATDRGMASLLSSVMSSLGRLVKGEIMLARAEATQGLKDAVSGIVKIAIAAVLALVALNVLAGAAVGALVSAGFGPGMAGLLVAVVLLGAAVALALAGRSALRLRGIWPDRAIRGLGRDADALQAGFARGAAQSTGENRV